MSQTSNQQIPNDAPFSSEQVASLNSVFGNITSEQATYLKGFLAGIGAGGSSVPAGDAVPLTVFFGSESGNAEGLANKAKASAEAAGFAASVVDLADVKVADLARVENALVLISTWGEGDPPSRVEDFYDSFMGEGAPKLEKTRFSVLGLGDTSYEHFNQMGVDFDARFEALGATRFFDLVKCDLDFEDPYNRWVSGALATLADLTGATQGGAATSAGDAAAPAEAKVDYNKKNPFMAPLLKKYNLNGDGSAKETVHAEICLNGSGLSYEPGDALGVIPRNAPDLIEEFLQATGIEGRENVAYGDELAIPFVSVLRDSLDLRTVSKTLLTKYAKMCLNQELLEKVEDREWVKDYAWGRDWVDVVKDYPSHGMRAGDFIRLLRPLSPRLYSIASSVKAHPDEVHLTVGAVRYEAHGREKKGVCSTFIADLWEQGGTAGIYFHHNKNFKLPQDPSTPVIMVGPGTGIAPFRAFIEEIAANDADTKSWLFFGDQHEATDYLYKEELEGYVKEGRLTKVDLAFSRDQENKIYVQDRMRENAEEIWKWLDEGAYFYVCGDASRMAKDVHQALLDIISEQGKMDDKAALAYLKGMQKERRYARDVY
ncbi:MAG: flavodoxin domain-containing protein [Verrucomicrobiota bacterium]